MCFVRPSLEVYRCLVGEPEPPVRWCDVVGDDGLARGVGGELEAERLAAKLRESLVRGAPVVAHADPPGAAAALHPHLPDVASTDHVCQPAFPRTRLVNKNGVVKHQRKR
jgi:hypothetical protein